MKWTKEDLEKYKGFKSVVEQSDMEVKGKAVITVAILMKWFMDLEGRIKQDLLEPVAAPIKPKKVKEPITKV